ncbi:MAG: homoserine kinase [Gammaproteobacteria bacterium]|nr:homoserine kinase [Gammaproteobacteria bacterium]
MSVYTSISEAELKDFLTHYDLGELVDFAGISSGIENTNYFVNTSKQQMVLTIFENHSFDEMGYFLDLMAHLAEHEVPSAHPLADRNNQYLRVLKEKPAALVMRLAGCEVTHPEEAHCAAIGAELARLHIAGQEFRGERASDRGPSWWRTTAQQIGSRLTPEELLLLEDELEFQSQHRLADLPRGVIHADLFRDNALFEGENLTGLIDFYYACNDLLLYDIAVTVNDWCCNSDGSLDQDKSLALLQSYHNIRPLTLKEHHLWPAMLRAGALRFWLSRLKDKLFPKEGELTQIKDPQVFENILRNRRKEDNNLTTYLSGISADMTEKSYI